MPRSEKARDLMIAVEDEDEDFRSDAAAISSIYATH